jgi:quercetin 2,3-dioxygenase
VCSFSLPHSHCTPILRVLPISHYTDQEKKDQLVRIVAPLSVPGVTDTREGKGPAPIHSPISVYATIISPSVNVLYSFPAAALNEEMRKSYVHVIQTSGYNTGAAKGARVKINGGLELAEGDGAFALGKEGDKLEVENVGNAPAEVLVFDVE